MLHPSLAGKNAIVTGSISWIGLGKARALVNNGCNVTLNGFGDPGVIQELCAELNKLGAARVRY